MMKKFTSLDPVQLRQELAKFRYFSGMADQALDIYLVTPLLNFSFNEMYLNRISNDFTKYIQKMYKGVEGALILMSKPPRLPCVLVSAVEKESIIFHAHMLSLSITTAGTLTSLPLMCIVRSKNAGLENHIISFLEKRFCCAINRCELSDTHFQWLIGIAVNETIKRYINDGITITYKADEAVGAFVHFTLTPEDLNALWRECTPRGFECLDLNWTSVEKFVLAINEHFFNTFGLNTIGMPAERVIVEGVSIARLHTLRMKVNDVGLIFVLLKFVETACIKGIPFYSPMNSRKLRCR